MKLYDVNKQGGDANTQKPFSMTGELGLMAATGNSSGETVVGRIDGEIDSSNWNNHFIAEFLRKQRDVGTGDNKRSKVTAQKAFLSAQVNLKLENQQNRLFLYGDYENDRFNGFDYRASLAAGWSTLAWKDEISELKYSIGPGYGFAQAEPSSANESNNSLILRAAMEFKYRLSKDAQVRQFVSLEAGQNNTKSKSETSLSSRIFGELAMKLSFIMNHNDLVSEDTKPLDTEARVTLVYSFF